MAYAYAGQRAGRPHLATWAEAGLTTAAGLLAGNEYVRPRAAGLLRRGLTGIPEHVRDTARAGDRWRVRADAGYFTADLAHAAVDMECFRLRRRGYATFRICAISSSCVCPGCFSSGVT